MAKLLLTAGHGGDQPGAVGCGLTETNETHRVIGGVVDLLRQYNSDSDYIQAGCYASENLHEFDAVNEYISSVAGGYYITLHFNAGGGTGTEVYYNNGADGIAGDVLGKLVNALGLTNRGKKPNDDLRVLNQAESNNVKGILIEVCFVDSPNCTDANVYNGKVQAVIDAVYQEACSILGTTPYAGGSNPQPQPDPTPTPSGDSGYDSRIVNDWAENGSWISTGDYNVVAYPTLTDAIDYNDNFTINETYPKGEIIAEYDHVYQDSEFNYIHWVSDNGEHRYAPTSKIGGENLIGYFE